MRLPLIWNPTSLLLRLTLTVLPLHAEEALQLRYLQPAQVWTEALPIGNGRLGAMVFGDPLSSSCSSMSPRSGPGVPKDGTNPAAKEYLPQIRAALFAGDYVKATALSKHMQGPYTQAYQPLGTLRLTFPGTPSTGSGQDAAVTGYERTLDLDRAVATVRYTTGGAIFTREVFSSFPDQVMVVRLTCDQPGKISFTAAADSLLRHAIRTDGKNTLILRAKAPVHSEPSYRRVEGNIIKYDEGPNPEGIAAELQVRILADGGRIVAGGSSLAVEKANSVTLLLSAGTSFNGPDKFPGREGRDPTAVAQAPLAAAESFSSADLLARHVADHQALFRRVALDLGTNPEVAALPTAERLARFAAGQPDPGLSTLLYQYGRYLLIACSRPGGLPANLQGPVERLDAPAMEFELYAEHQHRDELLARRGGQPGRVP